VNVRSLDTLELSWRARIARAIGLVPWLEARSILWWRWAVTTWGTTRLHSERDVTDLLDELRGKRWLCRGQSSTYDALVPSIDRPPLHHLVRSVKVQLEQRSIALFRETAKFLCERRGGARSR
jgi:hypothetical protein